MNDLLNIEDVRRAAKTSTELLKYGGKNLISSLHQLIRKSGKLKRSRIMEESHHVLHSSERLQPQNHECENHQEICLICLPYEELTNTIKNRLEAY